jgi:hypothetical protein
MCKAGVYVYGSCVCVCVRQVCMCTCIRLFRMYIPCIRTDHAEMQACFYINA